MSVFEVLRSINESVNKELKIRSHDKSEKNIFPLNIVQVISVGSHMPKQGQGTLQKKKKKKKLKEWAKPCLCMCC